MIKGIGASNGTAAARAFLLKREAIKFQESSYRTPQEEKLRLKDALERYRKDTAELAEYVRENAGPEEASILEAHILISGDSEISAAIDDVLKTRVTAEAAVESVYGMYAAMFEEMDDEMMKQRASDFADVKTQLLGLLTGITTSRIEDIKEECVIVTHDLAVSEAGRLNRKAILGILTETGVVTGHMAVLVRAMGIPLVLGADRAAEIIKNGDIVVLNGETGEVTVNAE